MRVSFCVSHFTFFIISLFFNYSCSDIGSYSDLTISDAYVKAPLVGSNTTAGYLSITNESNKDISINGISCDNSEASYFHDNQVVSEGMITMQNIDKISINSGETVHFKPGSKHVMIDGLKMELYSNKEINCIFFV